MLSLITVSLFVAGAIASGQVPGYPPQQGYGYGRNYFAEIAEAHSRFVALNENDLIITNRLSGVGIKINLVNNFREILENTTLPAIKASMAAQDDRIAYITARLKALSVLFDDVDALRTQVDNLVGDLKEVRATHLEVETDLGTLENEDVVQNQGLAELKSQVKVQDGRLDEADEKISYNEEFAAEIYNRTIQLVDIVNRERSEVFTIALDAENNNVTIPFSTPFADKPYATWGIVKFSATEQHEEPEAYPDPYAEEELETLYTHVDITTTNEGFTATLIDESNKWLVERIVVRASFFYVDPTILSVH